MIETERLILRPFTQADAADLYEYCAEPTVHCFESMRISTMEEAEKQACKRSEDAEYYFAITLKDSGKVIGEIFSEPERTDHENTAAPYDTFGLCWMLNPAYQHKGYAFEAARAYFCYLFDRKGARRIYAYTEDNNLPSQRLCERLGMRQEGLFREFVSFVNDADGNPIYENTMQYAILKKEWK